MNDNPVQIAGALFEAVQQARIFPDSKTFPDCRARVDAKSINDAYVRMLRDFVAEPKKKVAPPPASPAGSTGETALRALQADFAQLIDEAVQRKYRLQISALESQVEAKGEDALFLEKVEALHGQVKAALAKQQ